MCAAYPILCPIYRDTQVTQYFNIQVALRPSTQTEARYYKVTAIVVNSMKDIFGGKVKLVKGLYLMDELLRKELSILSKSGPGISIGDKLVNGKTEYKNIEVQLMTLLLFIGLVVGLILLHRKVLYI